jgi:hypothetical protein
MDTRWTSRVRGATSSFGRWRVVETSAESALKSSGSSSIHVVRVLLANTWRTLVSWGLYRPS